MTLSRDKTSAKNDAPMTQALKSVSRGKNRKKLSQNASDLWTKI